ncbi:anti-sigma factor family protein [Ramlibacter sp. MAHUQ-53]|uniref:anti-sigma factor family protein n=1 Tax=unclassified Ramlibacter TaxID=2617605 RepID=UPI00362C488F
MSDPTSPPADDELHALVDGRLAPADAARLQARVDAEPALAARVAAWRRQRELLRAHLREDLDEPLQPPQRAALEALARGGRRQADWRRWGGRAAAVLLAFGLGWFAHGLWPRPAQPGLAFARQALAAHVVYVPEQRHPVEVEAAQHDHLVQWLSRRLGRPLKVPQLAAQGFQLVGGRLLPGENGARAQFMYQDAGGERLTLYLGALPQAGGETAFRFTQQGRAATFYWVDQGFGYALAGQLPRERLMEVAREVYRQVG